VAAPALGAAVRAAGARESDEPAQRLIAWLRLAPSFDAPGLRRVR
jgi:hypothetical protein